jgi:hypothetical protein
MEIIKEVYEYLKYIYRMYKEEEDQYAKATSKEVQAYYDGRADAYFDVLEDFVYRVIGFNDFVEYDKTHDNAFSDLYQEET